jgi:hypothetical protein
MEHSPFVSGLRVSNLHALSLGESIGGASLEVLPNCAISGLNGTFVERKGKDHPGKAYKGRRKMSECKT